MYFRIGGKNLKTSHWIKNKVKGQTVAVYSVYLKRRLLALGRQNLFCVLHESPMCVLLCFAGLQLRKVENHCSN